MAMKNPPHPGDPIRTEIVEALGLNVSKMAKILKVRQGVRPGSGPPSPHAAPLRRGENAGARAGRLDQAVCTSLKAGQAIVSAMLNSACSKRGGSAELGWGFVDSEATKDFLDRRMGNCKTKKHLTYGITVQIEIMKGRHAACPLLPPRG
jgi:hypothetical protein